MYRSPVMGKNGLVTSAHPLASQAGIEILQEGGNAFDAVVAVNAVLGVVHPHKCGIGGDVFFLLYSSAQDKICFLNGSGRSPLDASIETIVSRGYHLMPNRGVLSVTVPGCVQGWEDLRKGFGSLPMERLLRRAVAYAKDGYPLSYQAAADLEKCRDTILQDYYLRQVFTCGNRLLTPGETVRLEPLARTLEYIGQNGAEAFYKGDIARKINDFMLKKNGLLTIKDFELHYSIWDEPIRTSYAGYTIYQTPPNTQGLAVLLAFNILEGLDVVSLGCDTPEAIHYMVEAKKLAYDYRDQYITDPEFVPVEYDNFLDKQYASRLRKMIQPLLAGSDRDRLYTSGNTTAFSVADGEGNIVAGIQSLYYPFGAGCTVDDTGIILQNRGASFSLDPSHINRLEPLKRPYHTLTASIVTQQEKPILAFSATGADGQPQTHLQVISKLLHFGYNIQDAIEAPRWVHGCIFPADNTEFLNMEGRFSFEIAATLESWGHHVRLIDEWAPEMGQAQGIVIDRERSLYCGGADPRTDGYVAAF